VKKNSDDKALVYLYYICDAAKMQVEPTISSKDFDWLRDAKCQHPLWDSFLREFLGFDNDHVMY